MYRESGCIRSRDRVVESHMPMIAHFAKRCASNRTPFDDLMAEGAVIVMRSIELYDLNRGVPFAAYAAAALKVGLVGVSARTHEAWRARAAIGRRERAAAQEADPARPASAPVTELPSRPQTLEAAGVIQTLADSGATPDEQVERSDAVARMEQAIGVLSPISAAVLCKRFGVLGEREHSASELSVALGMEPRAVNRALLRALEELRRSMNRQEAGVAP